MKQTKKQNITITRNYLRGHFLQGLAIGISVGIVFSILFKYAPLISIIFALMILLFSDSIEELHTRDLKKKRKWKR